MAKNTHLEHLEDDIVNQGKAGGLNSIKMLRELGKMLPAPNSSVNITIRHVTNNSLFLIESLW